MQGHKEYLTMIIDYLFVTFMNQYMICDMDKYF
jgi:hypothetical protein